MITREEMQKALRDKNRKASRAAREQANKTIEYASKLIRKGIFTLANGPVNKEVMDLVKKSFKKEGIDVMIEVSEIPARTKVKGQYTKQCATYKFVLSEDG